ncbi:phosphoribosyltransferase [Micromonospora sp. NPDC050397]|uniref:phosphoribosyltransferase n=1 Tax=Micromonospora sp. NPDC050397 TaxID=3364279 RepID=UPI00384E4361
MTGGSFGLARFGLGSGEEPSEIHLRFYHRVAELVLGGTVVHTVGLSEFRTVETGTVLEIDAAIYQPLFQSLKEIPPDVDLGILDLSVITKKVNSELFLRPGTMHHIGSAIVTAIESGGWTRRQLVILLPPEPARSEKLRQALDPYMGESRIVILSDDGDSSWSGIDPSDYRGALAGVTTRPIDGLDAKLITRLGWFRPHENNGDTWVLRHYFDAQKANDELGELLDAYVGARRPDLVAYHESASDWLAAPLQGCCIRADSLPMLSVADWTDPERDVWSYRGRSVLLVVPLMHRGVSLLNKIAAIEDRLAPRELRILAVLSAEGSKRMFGSRRIGNRAGRMYEVDYFLSVQQVSEAASACRFGVFGETRQYAELTDSLTTGEFWELVRLCGSKPEENVPDRRKGYNVVPDLPAMLDRYGNWLTDKLWRSIQRQTATVGQDLVLVCPDGERGSRKVSQRLSLWSGARVIRIPRDVIELVANGTPPEQVCDRALPWCRELASVARREVVLTDEFVGDGETMRAMERIVVAMNLSVTTVCALVDFAPDDVQSRHSLYSWRPQEESLRVPKPRLAVEGMSGAGRP